MTKPAPRQPLCSAGHVATLCCVGDPWAALAAIPVWPYTYSEPLPPAVISVAAEQGIDPHELDYHVEALHGWEPHDDGYSDAVSRAADCLRRGDCQAR